MHRAKRGVPAPVPGTPVVGVFRPEQAQFGGDFGPCRWGQTRQDGDEGGNGVGAEGEDVLGVEAGHPGGVGADNQGVGIDDVQADNQHKRGENGPEREVLPPPAQNSL